MRHHFVYVAGLGDGYDWARKVMLWTWTWRRGVSVKLVSMRWGTDETYKQKKQRVLSAVLSAPRGAEVVIVGESAGGAVATTIFLQNISIVNRLVTICGKNKNERTVGAAYARKNPALKVAVQEADHALVEYSMPPNRARTIYTAYDEVVANSDSVIKGAQRVRLHSFGHLPTIVYVVLIRFDLVAAAILKGR